METLKFKTNINCGGCIATVTPVLNGLKGVQHWEVDTTSPDKVLTIQASEGFSSEKIIGSLEEKGYNAQLI